MFNDFLPAVLLLSSSISAPVGLYPAKLLKYFEALAYEVGVPLVGHQRKIKLLPGDLVMRWTNGGLH